MAGEIRAAVEQRLTRQRKQKRSNVRPKNSEMPNGMKPNWLTSSSGTEWRTSPCRVQTRTLKGTFSKTNLARLVASAIASGFDRTS